MSLYLSHEIIIFWMDWIIYGTFKWEKPSNALLPMWAIPIHVTLSLILGILLTKLLEEPARRWLKQEGKEKRNWLIFFSAVIASIAAVGVTLGLLFHGGNVM